MANDYITEEEPEPSGAEDKSPLPIKTIVVGVVFVILLSLFIYARIGQSRLEKQVTLQLDSLTVLSNEIKKLQTEIQAQKDIAALNLSLAKKKESDAREKARAIPKKKPASKPKKKK